ncbi:MAG: CCHC-type zinc finger protein, partial [Sweet potato little leaf phytoplasma]|nr:CCHC-type zinc finger protein [Sweet potato little leaf phytoplasma]
MGEYASKFEELIRFSPYYQQNPDERSKCIKFENGLHPEIKVAFGYQGIRNFPQLVNMCRTYEDDLKAKEASERNSRMASKSFSHGKDKGKAPYRRGAPNPASRGGFDKSKNGNGGGFVAPPSGSPAHCVHCNLANHGTCRMLISTKTCFTCGERGHMSFQCPKSGVKKEVNNVRVGGSGGRPTHHGRVFTMSGSE